MINDFENIIHVIEIIDDEENFIHAIYLISKIKINFLNEIHIKLIVEKYEKFLNENLILVTKTLNPLMVKKKKT